MSDDGRLARIRDGIRTLLGRRDEDASIAVVESEYSRHRTRSWRFCIDYVRPAYEGGSAVEFGADSGDPQTGYTDPAGVVIEVDGYASGLEARISEETTADRVALVGDNIGEELQQIKDVEAGETVTFDVPLEDGRYRVLADKRGEPYARGRARVDLPLEAEESLAGTDGEEPDGSDVGDRAEEADGAEPEPAFDELDPDVDNELRNGSGIDDNDSV